MDTDLSNPEHWDTRAGTVRPRVPSRLDVGARDITNLLARHVRPSNKVLEIGCAPGKFLLWCAVVGQAEVSGIEYAPKSHRQTTELFRATGILADLRCEDAFSTSFRDGSFDVVYSVGLIEHFTGERLIGIIRKHADLLKPGGTAIIVVPNFSGWYGALVKWNDPAVYAKHNVGMMNVEAMLKLAPSGTAAKAYRYGMLTPWIVSYGPNSFGKFAMYGANLIGLLQPFQIKALCPWLVLELSAPVP